MTIPPPAPNPSTGLARVVVDELARCGVRHLALAPGSRSAPVAIAAREHPGIQVWVHLDERSAAFFALGVGKATGHPAVMLTTSGTAVANCFPAVVEADAAAAPLIVCTADRPPELRDVGANQTIDQVRIFGRTVRWFCELGPAEDREGEHRLWRTVVDRAVAEALGDPDGGSGPVHLNLAFREPLVPLTDDGRTTAEPYRADVDGRPDGGPWTRVAEPAPLPPEPVPDPAVRPVVVVGDARGIDVQPLLEAGVPVIAEGPSGARRPGTISTAHHLLSHPGFTADHRPDLVVTVGRVGLSPHVAGMVATADRQVAVARAGWPDPHRTATELRRVFDLSLHPDPGWGASWAAAEATARAALDAALDEIDQPTEPRIARDTADAVPDGGTLVVGSSMPVRDLDWFARPRRLEVVANRGASGIDGLVSLAQGAAAGTAGPVVALAGDLSMLHDQNGLLLPDRPPVTFVVVDNDGGGIFSFLPQARLPEHLEPLFTTPHGLDLSRLAELHGLDYRRIADPGELIPAVAAPAPGLVHVPTDRDDNVEVHRRLTEAVHAALDRA